MYLLTPNGNGYGSGYGNGNGYGDGNGYGNGYGDESRLIRHTQRSKMRQSRLTARET